MTINIQVKKQDSHLVQIAKGAEIAFDVITQGVVGLVDNLRKGTVEAITYTIVDTKVIIEVTTHDCIVTGRLAKAERIAKACNIYLEKLNNCEWQPHIREAAATTYNLILAQELKKVAGSVSIEDMQFVNKN
jgi:hypothetical protein